MSRLEKGKSTPWTGVCRKEAGPSSRLEERVGNI